MPNLSITSALIIVLISLSQLTLSPSEQSNVDLSTNNCITISEYENAQFASDDVDCSESTIYMRHEVGVHWESDCILFGNTCIVIVGCTKKEQEVYWAAK